MEVFPDSMRSFERSVHDGIILDDVRDLAFVAEQQDILQGKYDARVELATSSGDTCAYSKYLYQYIYQVPIAVSINHRTRIVDFLLSRDCVKKFCVLVNFLMSYDRSSTAAASLALEGQRAVLWCAAQV